MHDVISQRAHRLGQIRNKPRPIIVCFRDSRAVEFIMSKAHTLQGSNYGINRDYPDEIVKARSRLWADYKETKPKYLQGKVYIGFPAKLVVDGEVVRDEFPDWKATLKGSRVEQSSISKGDYKPGYPERGRGRYRGLGRGRGRGRSQ